MLTEAQLHDLFSLYYSQDPALLETVLTHSEMVARKAVACAKKNFPDCDLDFIHEAALLHDIGVVKCNAPGIGAHGDLPYLCHGVEGRYMLEKHGLEKHALVCERHTGSGLTKDEIIRESLPLPHRDMLPISIEEKAICYADCFFSKSGNLTKEKDLTRVMKEMERFGKKPFDRFVALHKFFK